MKSITTVVKCCLGILLAGVFAFVWLLYIGISEDLQLHSSIPPDGYPGIFYGVIITAVAAVMIITIALSKDLERYLYLVIIIASVVLLILGISFWRSILFLLLLVLFTGIIAHIFDNFPDYRLTCWFTGIGLVVAIIGLTPLAVNWQAERNIAWAEFLFSNKVHYSKVENICIFLKPEDVEKLNKHLYYYHKKTCPKNSYELDDLPPIICGPGWGEEETGYIINPCDIVNPCDTALQNLCQLVYYSGNKKKIVFTFDLL